MHPRNDVLAQVRDELLGATDEDIADLLFVPFPVDVSRFQRGVRFELERMLAGRRHLWLVERGDVQEERSLFDIASGEIRHRPVDIVVRVNEVESLDLVAIRFQVHIDAEVHLEDRGREGHPREPLAQLGRHVARVEHLEERAPGVAGRNDVGCLEAAAIHRLDAGSLAVFHQDTGRLAAGEQRAALLLEHFG